MNINITSTANVPTYGITPTPNVNTSGAPSVSTTASNNTKETLAFTAQAPDTSDVTFNDTFELNKQAFNIWFDKRKEYENKTKEYGSNPTEAQQKELDNLKNIVDEYNTINDLYWEWHEADFNKKETADSMFDNWLKRIKAYIENNSPTPTPTATNIPTGSIACTPTPTNNLDFYPIST